MAWTYWHRTENTEKIDGAQEDASDKSKMD